MSRIKSGTITIGFTAIILFLFNGLAARGEIPVKLEPDYAEAVLAYNAKSYGQVVRLLDALLKKAPNTVEFLELQALALKAEKNTIKSAETYELLIQAKIKDKKPAKEQAPYHFELGMIRYQEKKIDQAQQHFKFALDEDFNAGVSHLYLGMMAFQAGKWADSAKHFRGVVSSDADDLSHIGYFYLGQTYFKIGYPGGATESFGSARRISRSIIKDRDSSEAAKKTAQQIFDATEKALAPFDHGQFFGSIGFMTGYDSNLLSIPSSVTSDSEVSRKASAKSSVMLGAGYASSPLGFIQFVPSYRGSFVYHLNDKARASEFYDHGISLYMTRNPLLRTNYGLKVEGTAIFKNDVESPASRTAFKTFLYSKSASIGPYLKTEIAPQMNLGFEAFFQPQKFTQDGSGEQVRSGNNIQLRTYFQADLGKRYWNPSVALRWDENRAKGKEYQSRTQSIDASDLMHLNDTTDLTGALALTRASYANRPSGSRTDKTVALRMIGTHKLTRHWTMLANTDFTKNISSIPSVYSYNRFTFSAGVTYAF